MDEGYRANIHRIAQIEMWGVNEALKEETIAKLHSLHIDKKIENEDLDYQMRLESSRDQEIANQLFINTFENFSRKRQLEVLDHVEQQIKHVPGLGGLFIKARKEFKAHKDLMFRKYLKEALKYFD